MQYLIHPLSLELNMKNVSFFLENVTILKSIKYFSKLFIVLIFISNYGFAGNYPLEILQPEAGLDTTNRFYKAYPGLEYNVRMGVIGGKYPFTYALTTAPSGMSIDSFTGEITWPAPSESGTPYDVTAIVTDTENTTETISWTVSVTTAGFYFVDAVNGTTRAQGSTGTINDPWKLTDDVFRGAPLGSMVYWRAGNYYMDTDIDDNGDDGMRVVIYSNQHSGVWMGYPGDTKPIFNQDVAHFWFYLGGALYLDGFHFKSDGNARAMGINISSAKNNVVIRRNKFSGITGGTTGGNNALVFFRAQGTGTRMAIQDNEFGGVDKGYGILNYRTTGVLVENNYFHDIGAVAGNANSHALGMKVRSNRWDVRSNLFRNNGGFSIWEYYKYEGLDLSGNNEHSYNVIEAGGGRLGINTRHDGIGDPVYVHRNTILDEASQGRVEVTNGPFYWYNNVIVNDSVDPGHISLNNISAPERLIIENNLAGTTADGIADAQGNLTAAYAEYIGNRGHQLGSPPSSIVLMIDR
jgi:hypothetical protein